MEETIDQVLLQITKVPLGKSKNHGTFKDVEFPQISVRSPLLRRKGTKFNSSTSEEIELQELNSNVNKGSYSLASQQQKRNRKPSVQKLIVDKFFNEKIDQIIINRIKSTENPISLKMFITLLEYYPVTKRFADKDHCQAYVKQFEEAVDAYIHNGNLTKFIKEFKYDYFDAIEKVFKPVILDVALECLN